MRKTTLFFLLTCLLSLTLAGCNLPGQNATSTPTIMPIPSATGEPPSPTATASVEPSPTAELPSPTATTALEAFNLSEIHMLNANEGWGTGRRGTALVPEIARTNDGGVTWTAVNPPDAVRQEYGRVIAFFLDDQRAWVIFTGEPGPELTGATIWRTVDSGASWQSEDIDSSGLMMEFFYPGQIAFFDAQNGWLVVHLGVGMNHDYVAVLTTADGGANWKYVVEPEKNNLWMSCQKNDVWFRDAQHAYAVGTCNGVMAGLYLYDTADGGETWNEVNLPAPAETPDAYTNEMSMCEGTDLRFSDAQNGRLLVRCTDMNDMQAQRWLYRTQDGGQNWSSVLLPAPLGEFGLLGETGWYISTPLAGGQVFHTLDGGDTWEAAGSVDWQGDADFLDPSNCWMIVMADEYDQNSARSLYRTSDGGATWEEVPAGIMP